MPSHLFRGASQGGGQGLLALDDIEHRKTRVRTPRTNGFVERFNRTVLDEFFRKAFREKYSESVEALQKDLVQRLQYHNEERPPPGLPQQGTTTLGYRKSPHPYRRGGG